MFRCALAFQFVGVDGEPVGEDGRDEGADEGHDGDHDGLVRCGGLVMGSMRLRKNFDVLGEWYKVKREDRQTLRASGLLTGEISIGSQEACR